MTPNKGLARDIDFFICDANAPGQRVVVEEKFHNLGLYMIPYGRNRIDVEIPATHRLVPHSTGIKMMLDLLHRSRLNFPSMAMGFLTRILDEATSHCRDRLVGGAACSATTRCRPAWPASSRRSRSARRCASTPASGPASTTTWPPHGLEANAIKTCITDLMQEAAQSLLQLVGAKGYRLDHFAGRAVVDSRPFQIFEGSNDILYVQIAEALLKQMKVARERNLCRYLGGYALTRRASARLKDAARFRARRTPWRSAS